MEPVKKLWISCSHQEHHFRSQRISVLLVGKQLVPDEKASKTHFFETSKAMVNHGSLLTFIFCIHQWYLLPFYGRLKLSIKSQIIFLCKIFLSICSQSGIMLLHISNCKLGPYKSKMKKNKPFSFKFEKWTFCSHKVSPMLKITRIHIGL